MESVGKKEEGNIIYLTITSPIHLTPNFNLSLQLHVRVGTKS